MNESLTRLKASDLVHKKESTEKILQNNYRMEYKKCLSYICKMNKESQLDEIYYEIPFVLPYDPNYYHLDCADYIKHNLYKAEFYTRIVKPGNILYISWKKEDVTKVKKHLKKKQEKELQEKMEKNKKQLAISLDAIQEANNSLMYNPNSAISKLKISSLLMRQNPKYKSLFKNK
jgi:hypothetical protein